MLQAIIFDLDGVIIDSEPHHLLAFQRALAPRGIRLGADEYYRRFVAKTDREVCQELLGEGPGLLELIREKQRIYRELSSSGVRGYPDALGFIAKVQQLFPLAVATGAIREEAEGALVALGVRSAFQVVVSCEDYQWGKPHPDPYLLAARLLKVPPGLCLVIEDAVEGVRAAKAAGMACLALTRTHGEGELFEADLILEDLSGLDPRELGGRF